MERIPRAHVTESFLGTNQELGLACNQVERARLALVEGGTPSFQCSLCVGAASLLRILGMSTQVLPLHLASRARIAVIGAGISGITAARELDSEHDVALYESREKAGGHTRTLRFERFGREFQADLGFMVFNAANYPHLTRLLAELEIPARDTEMSFSLRCRA